MREPVTTTSSTLVGWSAAKAGAAEAIAIKAAPPIIVEAIRRSRAECLFKVIPPETIGRLTGRPVVNTGAFKGIRGPEMERVKNPKDIGPAVVRSYLSARVLVNVIQRRPATY
ncbi:MAG: hypothetical protein ACXU95_17090, partial [Isosphaeraceae bacterium]